MTGEESKQLAGLWAMYAAYYRVRLEDQVLKMYADDLADLDFGDVRDALDRYRKNPKNRVMPMPSMIRDLLSPEVDPESSAREIAARIGGAVVKFGHPNGDQARAFIGETGWAIIERRGGWNYLCTNLGVTIDPTTLEAQIREQAKSDVKYGSRAMSRALGIASNVRHGELQSIGELLALPAPARGETGEA